MSSILVTTGATVTFTELLDCILGPLFLEELVRLGVIGVFIQYGNEHDKRGQIISKQVFTRLWEQHKVEERFHLCKDDNSDIMEYNGDMNIVAFPFARNLSDYINKVDLVISHAGTGSILDVLRMNKNLVVVLNDKLMHNHQREIALAFESKGYILASSSTEVQTKPEKLVAQVKALLFNDTKLLPLSLPPPQLFNDVINEEMTIAHCKWQQGYPASTRKTV